MGKTCKKTLRVYLGIVFFFILCTNTFRLFLFMAAKEPLSLHEKWRDLDLHLGITAQHALKDSQEVSFPKERLNSTQLCV